MSKNLFDYNFHQDWPDPQKFPINEETQGYQVKPILLLVQIHNMDSLMQATNTTRFQQVQLLSDSNSLIQPSLDIDSQYKQINNVYLNSLQIDSVSFNSSQLAILTALAYECPLIGGDAVFKARAMLALVENNVYFDDVLCSGIELRMAKAHQDTIPQLS